MSPYPTTDVLSCMSFNYTPTTEIYTYSHTPSLPDALPISFRYGADVEIAPRPSEEFIVVHHSIRGAAELTVDGQYMVLPQGRTGWMAPRRKDRKSTRLNSSH